MTNNADVPQLDRTLAHLMASHGLADSPRLPLLMALTEDTDGTPRTRLVDLPPTPPDMRRLDQQLDDLTRRIIGGQMLTSGGMPLPPATGLLVLHEELPVPPGQAVVYRVIDAIDITGHTAVASARPGHPATAVYPPGTRHVPTRSRCGTCSTPSPATVACNPNPAGS